jgi:hypothetical protein
MASCRVALPNLPSWCTIFDLPATARGSCIVGSSDRYCAGLRDRKGSENHVACSGNFKKISVEGFRIDMVGEVISSSRPRISDRPLFRWTRSTAARVLDWEQSALKLSRKIYGPSQNLPEARWRTIIANKVSISNNRCAFISINPYLFFKVKLAVLSQDISYVRDLQ